MLDRLAARVVALVRRLRRIERRELAEFRAWIEHTDNLRHLTVVLAVPLLIGLVTALSGAVDAVSFLLFPPLAAGTYTLFADPEGRYSTPRRFVGGLTAGAASGWVALEVAGRLLYGVPPDELAVHAPSAALAVFLTAVVTWGLDLELPTAFSTSLLVLTTGTTRIAYVGGMVLSACLVAGAFVLWRDRFYERRARYLYGAVRGDDHVLVPVVGRIDRPTVALAAGLAAAHEAGKVVLLDVVDDERIAAAERALLAEGGPAGPSDVGEAEGAGVGGPDGRDGPDAGAGTPAGAAGARAETETGEGPAGARGGGPASEGSGAAADAPPVEGEGAGTDGRADPSDAADADREAATRRAADEAAARLEREARRVRERYGVPCEALVAAGETVRATLATADEAGCDLVAAPIDPEAEELSPLVRGVFEARIDAVALRSETGRASWRRALVMVGRGGEASHAMIDFAERLTGGAGTVSLCSCIDSEVERRRAESRLADLAETARGEVETRVTRSGVEEFLSACERSYDLVVIGASGDRSRASRLVSPPTYRRIAGLDLACDVLVVD
ncbi:MAG: HPP family protein [Haloferacaceae archaeon]